MKKILAISLFVIGTTGILSAADRVLHPVPEIDAGSAASATALVSSALLMLRRKKAN
jgi:hypothetical protein